MSSLYNFCWSGLLQILRYAEYSFAVLCSLNVNFLFNNTRPHLYLTYIERFSYVWKLVSVSVRYLFYQPMDEKIKTWTLRFPAKENPNMEKALFDWPIVLQYDVKAKYRLISRKFSGMRFFHPSVRLTNQKRNHARLYPFDKPIKSLYFCSFVVSVLFARFHFKVIRKSLWQK